MQHRTVYAGTFVPYEERSSGLKYGGAAMVIGGALLAARDSHRGQGTTVRIASRRPR